jgi:hypothetical protein
MGLISYPLQDVHRESVRMLIDAFGEVWPDSHYGPMHILVDDYNALDDDLTFCRGFTQAMLNGDEVFVSERGSKFNIKEFDPYEESGLKASLLLLDMLALIPEEWRDIHAEATDA